MRFLFFLIPFFGIVLLHCTRNNCYNLEIHFPVSAKIQKDNPVFYGNGLIGNVSELSKLGNDSTLATLCILDSLSIPRNSVLVSGFIRAFGMTGIQVIPSGEKEYAKEGEVLKGISIDTIKMTLPELDSVFLEDFIKRLKYLQPKQ